MQGHVAAVTVFAQLICDSAGTELADNRVPCIQWPHSQRRASFETAPLAAFDHLASGMQPSSMPSGVWQSAASLARVWCAVLSSVAVGDARQMPLAGLGNELVWQSVVDSGTMATTVRSLGGTVGRYPGGTPR